MKGKKEFVAVYRPALSDPTKRADALPARARTNMVGRAREFAALTEQLQALLGDADNASGGCVVIEGEAGIGKSRLVEDLLVQAHELGVNILSGAGDSIERSTPYHAWRQIFEHLFELDELTDPASKRTRVLNRLPR